MRAHWVLLVFLLTIGCARRPSVFEQASRELETARVEATSAGLVFEPAEFKLPEISDVDNAAPVYRRAIGIWTKFSKERRNSLVKEWGDAVLKPGTSRVDLVQGTELINVVLAASARPHCDYGRDWRQGMSLMFTEFADMKSFAKLLAADAVQQARAGRLKRANRNLQAVQRIAQHAGEEPTLIAKLVAISISTIGLRGSHRIVGELGPHPDAISTMEVSAASAPRLSLQDAVRGEIMLAVASIRQTKSLDELSEALSSEQSFGELSKSVREQTQGLSIVQINRAMEARHLQFWTRVMNEGAPMSNEALSRLIDRMSREEMGTDLSHVVNMILSPVYADAGSALQGLEIKKKSTEAGAAILRSVGHIPKSADLLPPECREQLKRNDLTIETTPDGTRLITAQAFNPPGRSDGTAPKKSAYSFVYPFRGRD